MNDIPGMVAKVVLTDTHYEPMVSRARLYFDDLFRGVEWRFLGALIEPRTVSEAFGAAQDQPETWAGEFYAVVELDKGEDDGVAS